MTTTVSRLQADDRDAWELLYRGYAAFYKTEMTDQVPETVWGWIDDDDNPFFGLIAKDVEICGLASRWRDRWLLSYCSAPLTGLTFSTRRVVF